MDLMTRRTALLAAQKREQIIYEARNLTFRGNTAINTGVYLFTQENINRNFEVAITDLNGRWNAINTIVCAKHNENGYGFLIRTWNNTSNIYPGTIYVNNSVNVSITIRRVNGVITAESDYIANAPITFINNIFDWPLYLGCAVDDNGNPYRYVNGTIGHIVVKWL